MADNKAAWLTTKDIQTALAGRRNNDIKVEIRGNTVPLGRIYYHSRADCFILVPYNGEDLKTALAGCEEDMEGDMNYDESGHGGSDFEVIGPFDADVADLLERHPDWTDEQIAKELGITVWSAGDARSRA